MEEERTIWKGNSSEAVNLGTYVVCFLLAWLIIPIFYAFWKWLVNQRRIYEITTQRIRVICGVFTRRTEELELYRVNDTCLVEPFWYRMFRAGNIVLTTNDVSSPTFTIQAVKNAPGLREEIRKNVELCRDRKGVRVTEME